MTSHTTRRLSAVVVNFNGGPDLLTCVASLCIQLPRSDIIVVDNASTDGSVGIVAAHFPDVRILASPTNLGFAGGANLGAAEGPGDFLLFLNPDTFVMPGCVDQLRHALTTGAGVVGPLLRVGEKKEAGYGLTIDVTGMPRALVDLGPPLYVSGCCLATTRGCFDTVGGFDERYFLFVEDVEYCWQSLRRGYDVRVVPEAEAHHLGGRSIPGGYVRGGAVEVSTTRVVLRERNTTAMFLACAPAAWLPMVVAASLFRTAAFAGLLASRGRWHSCGQVLGGLAQNLAWLPETIRRRRRLGVTPSAARAAWRRVSRRVFLWEFLRARQPISFVDTVGPPPTARPGDS
ncbi:MAG TPA: glycosyltransferase family 2 protein [Candidatus Dormibacteraeota bacterium]|nr:glycosyltransferase family 2 protein [Candidatus Dormibacteraeota bacterium]